MSHHNTRSRSSTRPPASASAGPLFIAPASGPGHSLLTVADELSKLGALVATGRPVAVLGRADGRRALPVAVRNARDAVRSMHIDGVDARHLVPDEALLRANAMTDAIRRSLTARDHDDSYSTMCHVDTTALAQGLLTVTQWSNQDLRSRPASAGAADWELIAESLEPYAPALIYGDLSRHSPSAAAWMPLARMLSLVARATGAPVFLGWPGHGIRPAPQGRADRLSAVVEAAARDHEREVVTRRRAQGRGLARPPRLDEPR